MSELQAGANEPIGSGRLPGATLKQAREKLGWSVAEVAEKLHLTEFAVNSLEADRYEALPGVTFVRGYIRSYAKLVGQDPDALAGLYIHTGQAEPIRALPDLGRAVAHRRSRGRPVMALLLLVLLVVLAVGYFWWQDEQERSATLAPASEEIAFNQVEIERADGTLYIHSLDELDAYTADLEVAEILLDSLRPAAETGEQAEAVVPASTESEVSTSETTAEAIAPLEEGAQPVRHQLELRFTADCWIRVTDGAGVEVAGGLHHAGDVLQLNGSTPFELHLGNAYGVQLRFNGQPVDIHSSIRGNVARIKLG